MIDVHLELLRTLASQAEVALRALHQIMNGNVSFHDIQLSYDSSFCFIILNLSQRDRRLYERDNELQRGERNHT